MPSLTAQCVNDRIMTSLKEKTDAEIKEWIQHYVGI